jgi:hypothetical protein
MPKSYPAKTITSTVLTPMLAHFNENTYKKGFFYLRHQMENPFAQIDISSKDAYQQNIETR